MTIACLTLDAAQAGRPAAGLEEMQAHILPCCLSSRGNHAVQSSHMK